MKQIVNLFKNITLKKKAILVIAFFIFSLSLLLPQSSQAVSVIYLYQHTGYGGQWATFVEDHPNFNNLPGPGPPPTWNDEASSIKVPSGARATLYQHTGYGGKSKVFTADHSNFNNLSMTATKSWNDQASSIKICENHCSPSGKKQCTDNTHYVRCGNYDSDPCTEWSSSISCPSGQTCSGAGVCSTPTPVCSNDPGCDYWGKKECTDNTHYKTCASYDADDCLDWDPTPDACPSGQTCSGVGVCSTPIPTCSNECSPSGKKQCIDNTHYKRCGDYDADPCTEWSSSISCPSGQTCSGGVCSAPAATCDTSYPLNQFRACFFKGTDPPAGGNGNYLGAKIYSISGNQMGEDWGGGVIYAGRANQVSAVFRGKIPISNADKGDYKFTVETDDGAQVWVDGTKIIDEWRDQVATYTATKYLSWADHRVKIRWYENAGAAKLILKWESTAAPPCTNECSPSGKKQCTDNTHYKTCGDYDADDCLEWSSPTACPSGQTCSGAGVCSTPTPICSNDPGCDWLGKKECTDNTHYKTCANYDDDDCLDWSSPSACLSGYTCSGAGVCSAPSEPTEKILNVPHYKQNRYSQEYYVLDSATNQRVSNYLSNCGGGTSTIYNSGCAPTSTAMILDYYGKNKGVVGTANAYTDLGCHLISGSCASLALPYYSLGSEPYCSAVFEQAGLFYEAVWEIDFENIARQIAVGNPILVQVGPYYNVQAHAMVIKGYRKDAQGDITLYVNDPWNGVWKTILDPSVIHFYAIIY